MEGLEVNFNFVWDSKKARKNKLKHGVSFEEALSVFADPLAKIFGDEEHSAVERREIIIGHSEQRRLLLVSFMDKENSVRIISARKATRQEREDYEENVA